jgi:methyltransferase (TIGR00027 family)
MPIHHISDTALWVAYYRAEESERPGALFRDPLARQLAGVEGERIAREMGVSLGMGAGMAVRTRLIDDLILNAVHSQGVDCVINLACGLDARPYRLALPESLQWLEADLPALVEFKESRLGSAKPLCKLERCAVDLSDTEARRRFLRGKLSGCRKALILTEGLLCYLTEEQVAALARDFKNEPAAKLWITDLFSSRFIQLTQKTLGRRLAQGNAPIFFGGKAEVFRRWGWRECKTAWIFEEARGLKRDFAASRLWRPFLPLLPRKFRDFLRETYSISLLAPLESPEPDGT